MAVSLADSSVTTLKTTTFSNIDGIAQDRSGRFYVAHWGGNAVHRYEHDLVQAPVAVATGLSSPADIFYNVRTDSLGIPNSGNNTVKFVGFAPVSGLGVPQAAQNISVSPNPATDFLSIGWDGPRTATYIQVLDVWGQVLPCSVRQLGQTWQVDVAGLPSGWYVVSLRSGGIAGVGRFFKG